MTNNDKIEYLVEENSRIRKELRKVKEYLGTHKHTMFKGKAYVIEEDLDFYDY